MAGYNYHAGMSNNAVAAYQQGKLPLSKLQASHLRDAGLEITLKQAKELAKLKKWKPAEWHHSGGTWYNEVDFYDLDDLAELLEEFPEVLEKLKSGELGVDEIRVRGTYKVWGGSRSRPKFLYDEEFTGVKKGDWIHLDGGGRKKADGNHIYWSTVLPGE